MSRKVGRFYVQDHNWTMPLRTEHTSCGQMFLINTIFKRIELFQSKELYFNLIYMFYFLCCVSLKKNATYLAIQKGIGWSRVHDGCCVIQSGHGSGNDGRHDQSSNTMPRIINFSICSCIFFLLDFCLSFHAPPFHQNSIADFLFLVPHCSIPNFLYYMEIVCIHLFTSSNIIKYLLSFSFRIRFQLYKMH